VQLTKERARTDLTGIVPADALRGLLPHHGRLDRECRRRAHPARLPRRADLLRLARGTGVRVPSDTLRRIGYVAGIYKALQILYSDPGLADGWIRRPNNAFGGQTPLRRMTGGDVVDLAAVRNYLDAARAPWS